MQAHLIKNKNKIAWIIYNRPEQFNAIKAQIMNEIIEALNMMDTTPAELEAVAVITGAGIFFMAGANIKKYVDANIRRIRNVSKKWQA